jgi:penicillin amidase
MRTSLLPTLLTALALLVPKPAAAGEELAETLAGLRDKVQVVVDRNGFPHIYAETEPDAMFAFGYMHARDRLWQMDFNRRAAQGRLAEIMGSEALEHDVLVRTIGLNRLAELSAERVKGDQRLYENMSAYAWGVNSYMAEHMPDNLSFEFRQLGYLPEPWTITDSLAIGKAMAWQLCGSMDDLYMAVLVEKLGWETVRALFPVDRYGEIPIIPPVSAEKPEKRNEPEEVEGSDAPPLDSSEGIIEAGIHILEMASRQFRVLGPFGNVGSNNWVIDGVKSETGKPALASDPHLGFQMPSVWYVAHLKAATLDVMGVTVPGIPVVVIGHNRNVAWGLTNTQADVTDFFVETLNDEKTHYLHKGAWKPLVFVSETIKIRGRDPQTLRVPVTVHGPIIEAPGTAATLAIQWIGSEPDDDALAYYLLNHAADYDDFAAAMRTINAPPQNLNYADTNGMIAMWVAGLFPVRKSGDGRVPVDGSSGDFDWLGFIPRIDTPHSINPPQHYLASANQRPAPVDYPYYLGYEWDPGYRARRINQLLSTRETVTPRMMMEFQADTYDAAAASMLPAMLAACRGQFEESKLFARALRTLSDWDYRTTVTSPGPTIWWAWLDAFRDAVWLDDWRAAGIDTKRPPWGHTDLNKWQPPLEVLEEMVIKEPTSKWFDDVSTPERETLGLIAVRSFRQAVDQLFMRFGDDISTWQWGRVNRLRINHLMGDPLLVRGGQPLNGSDLALNARGAGREVTGGPSWRMVVDLSNLDVAYGILPGGQSGNPENPHYDDLLEKWVRDEYVPLLFYSTPEQFSEEQVEFTLRLKAPGAGPEEAVP